MGMETQQGCGMVMDCDIVVRTVAEPRVLASITLAPMCSHTLPTVAPTDSVEHAVQCMRAKAVRRLPGVEVGRAVDMVALGALAVTRAPTGARGESSAALPQTSPRSPRAGGPQ